MREQCQRCHEADEDRRTIRMECFYEMDELGLPFKHEHISSHIQDNGTRFYTLRVCKECRADWMSAIKDWFAHPPIRQSCGSGIFIRENGGIREITEEEWHKRHPDREPVRFKMEDENE